MPRFASKTSLFLPFFGAALLLATVGCNGGGGSPTAPETVRLSLASAAVSVDGTVYNGGTYHTQGSDGQSTRFEARLMLDGVPAPGEHMWVGFGHGMMNSRFALYDDGTHGDPVAGDGIYCLEDFDGQYGFHHHNSPHGDYHYDFWGEHHGSQSNHMDVTVHVVD